MDNPHRSDIAATAPAPLPEACTTNEPVKWACAAFGVPLQYRYSLVLPMFWVTMMVGVWCATWNSEQTMMALLAGLPGHWLPVALGVSGREFPYVQCVGGVLVMFLVGLLLDYLRVQLSWALVYFFVLGTALIGSFVVGIKVGLATALFIGCMAIYGTVVVLCGIGVFLALRRCGER